MNLKTPPLRENEIHIWQFSLNQPAAVLNRFKVSLSPDEIERAARFYFEQDRRRFITARGFLRNLLGNYLSAEPQELNLVYGKYGKPAVACPNTGYLASDEKFSKDQITFNLSHSNELVIFAFSLKRELGVDLEYLRPVSDLIQIARRFFSPLEYHTLMGLPDMDQLESFFSCWTRKEAIVKGVGKGLTIPLERFSVAFSPNDIPRVLKWDFEQVKEEWQLAKLPCPPGYIGALAVEGTGWEIRHCSSA